LLVDVFDRRNAELNVINSQIREASAEPPLGLLAECRRHHTNESAGIDLEQA
jgi:hypothetical protein